MPGLLSLPSELRLDIYRFVFRTGLDKPVAFKVGENQKYALDIFPTASLLLVNRLMNREATPVFWNILVLMLDSVRYRGNISPHLQMRPTNRWQQAASVKSLIISVSSLEVLLVTYDQASPSGIATELMRGKLNALTATDSLYFAVLDLDRLVFARFFENRVVLWVRCKMAMPQLKQLSHKVRFSFREPFVFDPEDKAEQFEAIRQKVLRSFGEQGIAVEVSFDSSGNNHTLVMKFA